MFCPKCHTPITSPGEQCSICKHQFGTDLSGKLAVYFTLKNEIQYLKSMTESFQGRMGVVIQKMQTLEATIQDLIEQQIREPEPETDVTLNQISVPVNNSLVKPLTTTKTSAFQPDPALDPFQESPQNIVNHASNNTTSHNTWEFKLGQKWLLIVGIIMMLFGIGFFLKYSFDQGWIGPGARVALAYIWGMAMLIIGNRFYRKSYHLMK